MNEEKELPPMPPLTKEEIERWIGEVEDKAWTAQANFIALRFLVGNLLVVLDRVGAVDARALIEHLLIAAASMDTGQDRLGIENLLRDLRLHFLQPKGNPDANNPGGAFH